MNTALGSLGRSVADNVRDIDKAFLSYALQLPFRPLSFAVGQAVRSLAG